MKHDGPATVFGPRSERSQRLIDQLELQLEELAAERVRMQPSPKRRSSRFRALRGAKRGVGTFGGVPSKEDVYAQQWR